MIQWESRVEHRVQKASVRIPEARPEKLHKRNMLQLAQDNIFETSRIYNITSRGNGMHECICENRRVKCGLNKVPVTAFMGLFSLRIIKTINWFPRSAGRLQHWVCPFLTGFPKFSELPSETLQSVHYLNKERKRKKYT